MSSTAVDEQYAVDRDAVIDEMARVVEPDEWRGGGHMRYAGQTITWGEYIQRRHELEGEMSPCMDCGSVDGFHHRNCATHDSDWPEERMDAIGANGPTGAHYAEDSDAESALSMALAMPSKYHVRLKGQWVDVYDVLVAFGVTNPADAHAIKKMLMPGKRGHKDGVQDRREAIQSLERAIELEVGQ